MATIAEIKAQYPDLGDLNDDQVVDALHQAFYQDLPRDQVAGALGIKAPEKIVKPPERNWLGLANDSAINMANSAVGLVKSGVDLVAPDSSVSGAMSDFIKSGKDKQSDKQKFLDAQLADKLKQDAENDGSTSGQVMSQLKQAGTYIGHGLASDPGKLVSETAGNLAPFLGFGKAMQAAKLGTGARTAVSGGLSGGLSAGEVRGNIWDKISGTPDADLMQQSPEYAQLRQAGASELDAKRELGANIMRNLPEIAAVGAVGAATGKYGVEGMASGVFPKMGRVAAGVVGGIDEGVVQGGTEQFASNYGVQRAMPSQSLTEGLGLNMAAEGMPGVAMGVASGGSHAPAPFNAAQPPSQPLEQVPPGAPTLQIGNAPDPLISFPDGTVARRSEIDKYVSGLPPDQQPAMRARMMGLAPQPSPADQLRATKVPESGPMTVAVNAGIESQAQDVESGKAPVIDLAMAQEADQAAYEQAMAQEQELANQQDSIDKPVTSGAIAEAQMSEEDKRAILFSNQPVLDGGAKFKGTQDGDVLNGLGEPFKTKFAAIRRANMEGKDWTISAVEGGWVARRKDAAVDAGKAIQPAANQAIQDVVTEPPAHQVEATNAPQINNQPEQANEQNPAPPAPAEAQATPDQTGTPARELDTAVVGVPAASGVDAVEGGGVNKPKVKAEQAPVATNGVANQPWSMTKDTFDSWPRAMQWGFARQQGIKAEPRNRDSDQEKNANILATTPGSSNGGTKAPDTFFADIRNLHKEIIEKALAEGRTVPAEVLADYPDLQNSSANKVGRKDSAQLAQPESVVLPTQNATNNTPAAPTGAPLGVTSQPAQPVTGEGAGVSQPTQIPSTNQGERNGNESTQASQAAETLLKPDSGTVTSATDSQPTEKNIDPKPLESVQEKPQAPASKATAKPKKLTPNQRIAESLKARADYFAPGNIVKGYSGYDRVISYKPPSGNGDGWSVTVQSVVKQDGKWVIDPKDKRERTHSTHPDKQALASGPVERVAAEQVGPIETTHNGTRLYKTKVKLGGEVVEKWAVESRSNKRKTAAGERAIGGDSLHDTLDAAKKAADFEAKQDEQAQARKAEINAQEKEAQAKKDANKGKSIVERRKDAILDGATKLPVQAGLGNGTKRDSMQKAVDQERAIVMKMVDDQAAKKRDNEAIDLVRAKGFILGLGNENLPAVKAGLEAQARLKANDYKKPSYRVYPGRDTNSSFYEITKTEYDYAQELKVQSGLKLAATEPQPAAQEPVKPAGKIEDSGEVQTKETDKGVAMFSTRTSSPEQQLPLTQIERLVQSALRGMQNAPIVRVVASPEAIGLTAPVDTVPSGVTLANGDIYVFQSGIGSVLDVDMVVFHELFHKGLQNVMPKADYVAAMLNIAKIDAKVREYAGKWSDSKAAKAQMEELAKTYSGQQLADNYEALAIEEGLAMIAEDLKAKRQMGTKDFSVRRFSEWLAKLADKIGMTRLANSIRSMSYSEAEKFVISTIGKAGGAAGGNVKFSAGDAAQTDTAAFKKWFGDSKVVDKDGKPMVVYHGTTKDFNQFSNGTGWFTADPGEANFWGGVNAQGSNVIPAYIAIKNPRVLQASEASRNKIIDALEALHNDEDGVVVMEDGAVRWAVPAETNQIKSATGNNGNFDGTNPDIRFRAADTVSGYAKHATDKLNEAFNHPGTMSMWHKTVGSMYDLAERSPPFKRVFDVAQSFIQDVSFYATEAADLAPKILPKLDTWKDMLKTPVSAADNKAISAPILQGTLSWARDESGKAARIETLEIAAKNMTIDQKSQRLLRGEHISESVMKMWRGLPVDQYEAMIESKYESSMLRPGLVFTDAELVQHFNLTPDQIKLYKEFRAATDKSLDNLAKADLLRFGGKDVAPLRDMVMDAATVDDAAVMLRDYLHSQRDLMPDRVDDLIAAADGMIERADKVNKLKNEGYAPLSRFGRYSVDVVVDGERQYFSLFESKRAANLMAIKLKAEFGADNVAQGTMSQKEFEQFQGITPESLELFGNMLGLDSTGDEAQDKAFQTYLKLTKTNRSAMKRMIHRKGTTGFSEDMGRVLAAFVYSNARQTSAALHMGELGESVNDIPKGHGELKDAAIELSDYIKKPREEAQALRGLLFAQFLGGSVASAFVNFTQPLTVSFPYLSQFGGATKAGAALMKAMQDQKQGKVLESGLAQALKKAEEDGVVSPQSVHELMAQAQGRSTLNSGDGTRLGDAKAFTQNNFSKLALGWGKLFGLAEQINRRSTFIAAYRIAVDQKIANPGAFATKAVNETQFISNKANKAKFGRGAIGATLMTFKSYSINYLELLHRMATRNGPEGKKAAALMLGMLFLMAGAGGLPFDDDLEDLADFIGQRLGYNFSSKKAKQEFLEGLFGKAMADFIDKGITGLPGSPIDTSGRMSMGNLIPGTGLLLKKRDHTGDLKELAGPVGDLIQRGFQGADKLLSGDIVGAAKAVAPKAVYNALKGKDMAESGAYNDDKGYKVIESTPFEAAMKAIGFQPASVADVQQSNYLNQRAKDFYSLSSQDINARWAKGIYEKDPEQISKAREMIKNWNDNNPDQRMKPNMPTILKRVREMRKDKAQRIADTAPKAMRVQMKRELATAV